ncbi:hypothetical protein R1sor_008762 [Riccia sorocarpa]|uniref:Uncharacterized protein n=1 Tax=Riccia sorocarpa TaxID=122646 RepID=A0ABD3HYG8_9MARC
MVVTVMFFDFSPLFALTSGVRRSTKALIQEKVREWDGKFGSRSLGLMCVKDLQETDIILTTPESFAIYEAAKGRQGRRAVTSLSNNQFNMGSELRDVSGAQDEDVKYEVIPSSVWDGKLSLLSSHYFIVTQPDAGYNLQRWPPLARILLSLLLKLKPEPLYNPGDTASSIDDLDLDELQWLLEDFTELDIDYHEEEICELIGRVLLRKQYPKLKKLMLRDEKQCASVLLSLAAGHFPNLSSLTLLNLTMGAEEIELLVTAIDSGHLAKLKTLMIDDNGFGDEVLSALGRAAERGDFENLEVLKLTQGWRSWAWLNGDYPSEETEEIAAPSTPKKFEEVDKKKGEAGESEEADETARLPGCEEDSILPSIEQVKRDVGDDGAEAFANGLKAGKLKLLQALDLCILSDTITSQGVLYLCQVFEEGHVSVLNTLHLVHTKPSTSISKRGADAVAKALTSGHVTQLQELVLGGFESGTAITSGLETSPFLALRVLRLIDLNLGAEEGSSIGLAFTKGHLPALTVLDLKDSVLGTEGFESLVCGFKSGNASHLYIVNLMLRTNQEAVVIAKALARNYLPNLDTLEVQGLLCSFGDVGAQALVDAYRDNSMLHAKLEMSWPLGKPWYQTWSHIWENNYYAWRGIDRSKTVGCCAGKPGAAHCHASDCEGCTDDDDDNASEVATTVDQCAFEIDASDLTEGTN